MEAFVTCRSEIERNHTSDRACRFVRTFATKSKDVHVDISNPVHHLKLPSSCTRLLEPPRSKSKTHCSNPSPSLIGISIGGDPHL